MYTIKPLPEFSQWLFGLKDGMTHRRLARRLEKAQGGNLGDVKSVCSRCANILGRVGACISFSAVSC
jgi:putative component of toxin-antitoxin plasmid stabilization module